MNALRRLCLAIYSLLLIAAAGALIALTWASDQQFNWTVGGWNFQALVNASDAGKIVFTIILGAIAVVGLLTLLLAVFRESVTGQRGSLRLRQTDGGTIEVTGRAIESLLRDELQRLPDVRSVNPRVRLTGGAVDTSLDAVISPTANIATVTSTLSQGVANILRDQVGVTNVRRPSIRIEQDATPDYGRDYRPAGTDGGYAREGIGSGPSDGGYARTAPADATRERETAAVPSAIPSREATESHQPSWPGSAPTESPAETGRTDAEVVHDATLPPPPSGDRPAEDDTRIVPPASFTGEAAPDHSQQSGQGHWEGDRWEAGRP
jgi:hypothetical protein